MSSQNQKLEGKSQDETPQSLPSLGDRSPWSAGCRRAEIQRSHELRGESQRDGRARWTVLRAWRPPQNFHSPFKSRWLLSSTRLDMKAANGLRNKFKEPWSLSSTCPVCVCVYVYTHTRAAALLLPVSVCIFSSVYELSLSPGSQELVL